MDKLDIKSILLYSPKKNNAKAMELYSTLYPATNSASASGKSKGARFVSANIEQKKITAFGNKGKTYQMVFDWLIIISVRLKDFARIITGNIVNPIETSYETIWAADLSAPKKAYFELLAQPPKIIP